MTLPAGDQQFLDERAIPHSVQVDGGMVCVVLSGWSLPAELNAPRVDVLIRLPGGYPDVAPDMWWVDPPLRRSDGTEIPATQVIEPHLGRQWQRWSRHFAAGQWQSGVDGLESYIALIRAQFAAAAGLVAA
jgi:hypothetical protein